MDISRLDEEAFAAASSQVAAMLRRSDQLQKLEQYQQLAVRKRVILQCFSLFLSFAFAQAAVEAMLKTTVQSQLEGVRNGLSQLYSVHEDVKMIETALKDVLEQANFFTQVQIKLKTLKEQNNVHVQCSSAMENLHAIYHIQETIENTYELLKDSKLLHVHKNLMELENARDDVMFEVFKSRVDSHYDQKILADYFAEVAKLVEELGKQLWYIVSRTLEAVRGADPGPQQLVTALRIIEREERIDQFHKERQISTGFLPLGRPRRWREKCFNVLENVVCQRIEGNQLEDRSLNKQWLARYLELCRMTVLQDLRVIKVSNVALKLLFCRWLYIVFSTRLNEIASDTLEKNELLQLLNWVRLYGFVEWYEGAAPEADMNGHYYTPLPSILFQMIDDQTCFRFRRG
ncbi:unnamed protein product [Soboliphyme baturini]|uniref:TNF receptor associated factor 3 n=1 Tax=Soboliphyme baturini TaxID=241478 RepID=A0A183IU05_9BILA|nr:unnamed protein product [Soboliphyme baturini]